MMIWNQASADPIRAAEALIKLEAREARLLGLDMSTQVAITDPDGRISAGERPADAGAAGCGGCDAGTERMIRAIEATALIQPSRPGRTTAGTM
jgi:hypothetical protein